MDQKIFEGAVDFESSPQDATLGASGGFLSAILIHFNEAPTTSEKLIISYKSTGSRRLTQPNYDRRPCERNQHTDLVIDWYKRFCA